jgi:DNA-binding FadR family transcriptional regulator
VGIRGLEPRASSKAGLHGDILQAIGHGDPAQASQASLRLNDYLTDFTYQTLRNQ